MTDLNELPLPELYKDLARTGLIKRLIELAHDEDWGEEPGGDVTSSVFVPGYFRTKARIVFRTGGVVSGLACIEEILHAFRADVDFIPHHLDGDHVAPGTVIAELDGATRAILSAERTILNTLGRLSGIASRTSLFVERIKGTKAKVYDTRKTTPGLRTLEKYAVRCGGGHCHRLGLYDAVLIKDNHLASLLPGVPMHEAVTEAVKRSHEEAGRMGLRFVMLEVDHLDQLQQILEHKGCGVDIVLLDNMSTDQLARAVQLRDEAKVRLQLEASGGVNLETIGAIAQTGVERISTGSLTHGATWVDVALDI
jgi:nicotinate-nucleotide pyrophosphorylase (carboxylating)